MAEDELPLGVDLHAPTESRVELAMRARIAARLDLDIGQAAQRIGSYEVLRRLGSGGMGVVYEARDPQLDRTVAIKLLRPDRANAQGDGHERLRREARALAKLSHPNVVQIHEVGEHDGATFVVMELVRGQTLFEWQRTKQPPFAEILAVYRQAGQGLAAAHEAGIVHRDFKPSNALIGDDGRVRVVDFGLAQAALESREADALATREGNSSSGVAGTPGYIAPEILAGKGASAPSDQFSFCVGLWEAVTGERPSACPRGHRAAGRTNPRFGGPAWLRRVLLRGLAQEPIDRWPDMLTLVEAFDRRPRRWVWLVVGLPILGVATALLGAPMLDGSPDPCAALGRDFDSIWNADAAALLRRQVATLGRSDAEADLLARALELQRSRWLDTEHGICEATHVRASWSSESSESATRCLANNLQQSREFIALFNPEIGDPPANIRALIAQLEDPRECMDLDDLARRPAGVGDDAIVTLRQSIARTRLLLAGETLRGDAESDLLLAQARELLRSHHEDPSAEGILGEALDLRAEAEQWRQRPDLALPLLREALPLARRSGGLELELRCLHRMAQLTAEQLEQPERAGDLIAVAAGVVPLVEPLSRATFEHALARAALARSEQRLGEAESVLRVAIAEASEDVSFADLALDRATLQLANVLAEQGKFGDAVTIYTNLLASLREQVGPDGVELGFVEFDIGLTLHEFGTDEDDEHEAERHLRTALAILERGFGPSSVRLSPTLSVLADIELMDGRLDDALRDAERAWQLQREQLPLAHGDRGEALKVIAYVHTLHGDYAAALATYEQMLEVDTLDTLDEQAELAHVMGWTQCRLRRCSEARPYFEDARAKTSSDQVRVYASVGLANADIADAKPKAALERLDALRPLLAGELAEDAELQGELNWLMARALLDAGENRNRARAHLRLAIDGYAQISTPPDIAADLEQIAEALDAD